MNSKVTVFFAYQFSSASMDRSTREHAISRAVATARSDLVGSYPGASLSWNKCELQSGKQVGEQILSLIEESDIFVADISESNPNVLFELGVAYGLKRAEGKKAIWLAHESVELTGVPSDLRGLYVERYSTESFESLLAKLTLDTAKDILSERERTIGQRDILHHFWRLQDKGSADIVCSEIPPEDRPYFADPSDRNYLRYAKFADLDTLIYLKYSLARLYPGLHFRDFPPSEYYDTNTRALLVVGGPPWNTKFREFQLHLPFRFIPRPLGEDDPLQVDGIKDVLFQPLWGEDNALLRDITLFVRMRVGRDVPVFLFGGCLTFGVLGSAMTFLDEGCGPTNASAVKESIGESDFILVAETERVGGFLRAPDLKSQGPVLLLSRSDQYSDWGVCINNVEAYVRARQRSDDHAQ